MRLIDADKIIFREIDEIGGEYEPYLGCSKIQIDSLPSITLQEPVIDKIRTEIEQIYQEIDTISHNEYENAVEQGKERAYESVLSMIDKYKAETEDT